MRITIARHRTQQLLLLTALVLLSYTYVDIPVAKFFHSLHRDSFYALCNFLTHLGESQWYLIPSLLLFFVYRRSDALIARASLFIFASVAASGILVNLVKMIFGRMRPKLFFNEGLYGFDWFHVGYAYASFPSGHATTLIGAWFAFALISPKYRIPFLVTGVLLALTRAVLSAHYISDILAGGALGAAVTLICYHLVYRKNAPEVRS